MSVVVAMAVIVVVCGRVVTVVVVEKVAAVVVAVVGADVGDSSITTHITARPWIAGCTTLPPVFPSSTTSSHSNI